MIYVWVGIAILILFLVWQCIRWWNLPKVEAERAKKVVARQQNRTKRVEARRSGKRREWFFRRKRLMNKEVQNGD
jgi:hypothetical protein